MVNAVIESLVGKIRIVRDDAEYRAVLSELAHVTRPVRVAFVNAHAVNLCCGNEDFLRDVLSCDYVFRDGSGMKILYHLLGTDAGLNMNGTDFIPRIIEQYKGRDISLMGTESPYLDKAAQKISDMGVTPVTVMDGFSPVESYVGKLKETPTPAVILAMGMPKQEETARRIAQETTGPCLIVCGGAILDFMGEKVTRAPSFFRKAGLEWAYRLMQEPRRLFKRYVVGNAVFLHRAFNYARVQANGRDMTGKKILHVVRQYHPAIGGLESYVQSIVKRQTAMGYECEVLTLNKVFHGNGETLPANEVIDGIPIRRVAFKGMRQFFIPLISPFYFKNYDLVHVHNTDVFYDYVALVSGITGVPAFATTHGGFFHTSDFSLIKKVYFNVITRLSSFLYKRIFAISRNDFDMFRHITGKITLLPNAVEPLGDFMTQGRDFLYIGRLARHKDVPMVIETFARLKQDYGVEGDLHIVGPEWDVQIKELEETAVRENVAGHVKFHGAADRGEITAIAKNCGYFLSASSFEGFGMSMIEAMSVGMVPFVHENESFRELVRQSGVGMSLDYGDTDKTAREIAAFLPSVTMDMREAARNFAAQFSWKKLVEDTDKIYRDYM